MIPTQLCRQRLRDRIIVTLAMELFCKFCQVVVCYVYVWVAPAWKYSKFVQPISASKELTAVANVTGLNRFGTLASPCVEA